MEINDSFKQWIHIKYVPHKKIPFIYPFGFFPLAFWYVTLIFPTESGASWISLIFLITFSWDQMKVQLLFWSQVTALSTLCQTNLHQSTPWGDFIKENSFAPASSRSISLLGWWKIIGSNWYTVPVYRKFCCVAPIGIVDDGPQVADDTSINWLPSLTVNLDIQNFNWSDRQSAKHIHRGIIKVPTVSTLCYTHLQVAWQTEGQRHSTTQ